MLLLPKMKEVDNPLGESLFCSGAGNIGGLHHAAQALRREIDAQIDARMPELLTMDFSGVTFMDSSGVGLILGRGRQMSGLGGRLVVQNAPDTVRRMLDLAHIHYV